MTTKTAVIAVATFVVMAITMIVPISTNVYAQTTEDDGWSPGDYEGTPEEQEEQAQQDWEEAGRL